MRQTCPFLLWNDVSHPNPEGKSSVMIATRKRQFERESDMADLSGKSIDRYRLVGKPGKGGLAVVYKSFNTRLETDVAFKIICAEKLTEETREAKAPARLTHPNIVKVTDYGEYEGKPYLVMPYLLGGTLKSGLGKNNLFTDSVQTIISDFRVAMMLTQEATVDLTGIGHRSTWRLNNGQAKSPYSQTSKCWVWHCMN